MYPSTHLPPPLPTQMLYILLALARDELHAYTLRAVTINDSLGSVKMADGTFYPILKRMLTQGLIHEAGLQPAGKSGQYRQHYRITQHGQDRLKQELKRLKHTVAIGEAAGYFQDELPLELQQLLRQLA